MAICEITGKEVEPMVEGLDRTLSQEGAEILLLTWYRHRNNS